MKVRIVWTSDALTLANVHGTPSWIERLLGRREIDAPAVLSGTRWLWDATGKCIRERCVIAALERERLLATKRQPTTNQ